MSAFYCKIVSIFNIVDIAVSDDLDIEGIDVLVTISILIIISSTKKF